MALKRAQKGPKKGHKVNLLQSWVEISVSNFKKGPNNGLKRCLKKGQNSFNAIELPPWALRRRQWSPQRCPPASPPRHFWSTRRSAPGSTPRLRRSRRRRRRRCSANRSERIATTRADCLVLGLSRCIVELKLWKSRIFSPNLFQSTCARIISLFCWSLQHSLLDFYIVFYTPTSEGRLEVSAKLLSRQNRNVCSLKRFSLLSDQAGPPCK